jgi:hypothetical protein
MKHAKLFSIAVSVIALGYGAIGFYFLPMAGFQGDLTRIGMLPESHFGWRKPQPAIDPGLMQQSSMQQADVLVIGDSFSDGRIWQTALTQRGLKVRTESWNRMRDICADFMPWLKAQGFAGKYVVLEYIERNLASGLSRSVACQHMQYRPRSSTDAPRAPPEISFDPDRSNRNGSMSIGIRTARNAMKYERLSDTPDAGFAMSLKGARIARVKDGCDLFSHRNCNDALFLGSDEAGDLGEEVMKNIGILDSRLEGVTPVWAFVPNKSTAYLYPGKQFWNEAERRFGAPNLLRMTQRAIDERVVDLYPANNTHFSTVGYLLMGEEIYRSMQLSRERPR